MFSMPASTTSFAPRAPAPPCDGALEAIAARAFTLRPPRSDERRRVCQDEVGGLIDGNGLLTRVARGHAALDLALGEALSTLAEDDRVLRLGFSNVRDYARERLGIGGSVAQGLVRLARELRGRPLLGAAVRSGEITVRQETVLPVWDRLEVTCQEYLGAHPEPVPDLADEADEEEGGLGSLAGMTGRVGAKK
jgi:hypothetical protein